MTCPLGLICEPDCINAASCYHWTKPWPLPYEYNPETKTLLVQIHSMRLRYGLYHGFEDFYHGFEDFDFDMAREWIGAGFADAIALPYKCNANGLHVIDRVSGFQQPSPLPYRRYLNNGCWCLHVRHTRSRSADLAGWVPAEPIDLPELPF
jgi:hypothetical protein